MSEYVKKDGDGTLFQENCVTVPRKGKILFGGEERYFAILKYQDPDPEKDYVKYELAMSVGKLTINKNKTKETQADLFGDITVDGKKYNFNGYKKVGKSGRPFTGVACYPLEDKEGNVADAENHDVLETDAPIHDSNNEDIPF
tara:strand:- start:100 stop:528 length:429 start_codon:yes stop_codon:yes gene_type:complete